MGDIGRHILRTLRQQRFGSVAQRAARIHDVVNQDAGFARHFTDDVHDFRLARLLAALVDDGQRRIEAFCQRTGAHHAAHVRRDHDRIAHVIVLLDVAHQDRAGKEIVRRDIEEALDLPGVKIKGEHPVCPCPGDHVGHELGRDRRARARFPVLPRVTEIRQHGSHPLGRGTLQCVDDDQQFHQVVVGGKAGGLHHEHVLAADVFLDFDEHFHVVEALNHGLNLRQVEIGADGFRQGPVAVTRHNFHHA